MLAYFSNERGLFTSEIQLDGDSVVQVGKSLLGEFRVKGRSNDLDDGAGAAHGVILWSIKGLKQVLEPFWDSLASRVG